MIIYRCFCSLCVTGSVVVGTPENAVKPTARITESAEQVNTLCPSDEGEGFEPVVINGQKSSDPSGRELTVTWGTNNSLDDACVTTPELVVEIDDANENNLLSLTLGNSSLSVLPEGSKYCITLTVTSFLEVDSEPATHQLEKLETSVLPVVTLEVPDTYVLPSPDGLRLDASVYVPSVCEGSQVMFRWSCERKVRDGTVEDCSILTGDDFFNNVLVSVENEDLTTADIVPQDRLIIKLEARYADNEATATSTQEVLVEGSDILAAFTMDTPQGEISSADQEVTFDATASFDPSDPSNVIPMRFSFDCVREDGFSNCFDDPAYTGNQDNGVWTVNASRYVDALPGERFFMQVEVSKTSNGIERSAVATRVIRVLDVAEILDFAVVRDCFGRCPQLHQSSRPLSFYANLDDEAAVVNRFKWRLDGNVVEEKDVVGGGSESSEPVSSASITLKPFPEVLPSFGEVTVECEATITGADGTALSGSSSASVQLTGPPVCALTPKERCLRLSPDKAEIPTIEFQAQATGFSGGIGLLDFEFGYIDEEDNNVPIQPASFRSVVPLYAVDGVRSYNIYVVAIDRSGGRSERITSTFELLDSEISLAELIGLLLRIDFLRLANTGDPNAVVNGYKQLNGFVNLDSSGGGNFLGSSPVPGLGHTLSPAAAALHTGGPKRKGYDPSNPHRQFSWQASGHRRSLLMSRGL
ncbi:hypothetical protein DUNSADRAFT_18290 [Dunaliella salina]|uniref:Uncharacterized protein n=1 Tax=Dunaliella salina TaxID=3046 RepID=A0ABQ7G0B8_DUNSA|nr:hypothetical protein DUNSADRAFT_18290 [Dunaliella salina]|eukprot:KAF5828049.1 hypothetical protein DUNSADRAFT_18290 [Dunaliella salina]